jgi:serine O-acetyltransferase
VNKLVHDLRETLALDLRRTRLGTSSVLRAAVKDPGFLAVCLLRLELALFATRLRPLAYLIRSLNLFVTGADVVPGAAIAPGLVIRHPNGIVIGSGARIGANCTLLQGVTLGERYADGRGPHTYPLLESDVTLGARATVLGGVVIGTAANVGAGSVVLTDIPPYATAVGAPAKVVQRQAEEEELR